MQKQQRVPSQNGFPTDADISWAPKESHPSQVSGMFQDDPTFEELCEILRQQREEDLEQTKAIIDSSQRKG
jgi:hypothetical protein